MAGTIVAGTLSDGTYSGSVTDTVRGACKAWVNFNGTGTVAIRAAYNVSSITDNGTGDYTVNFTTAMPDGNYALVGTGSTYYGNYRANVTIRMSGSAVAALYSTSQVRITTENAQTDSIGDAGYANIAVFR